MNKVSFIKALLEMDEELTGGQKKLDVAEPKGKLTAADFAALRAKKGMKEDKNVDKWYEDFEKGLNNLYKNKYINSNEYKYCMDALDHIDPMTNYGSMPAQDAAKEFADDLKNKKTIKKEGEDHEVSMAQNSLKSIISAASQLMNSIGQDEKDIPAWIQDHITNADNYINQASKNYHEYNEGETKEDIMDAEPNPYDSAEEIPLGDKEDLQMKLKSMMEDLFEAKKKKPSAGLSKKQKSAIVKKAKAGKDFGKKGKGFEDIEKKAKANGAENPEAVAGAQFWKGQAKKAK